MKKLRKIFKDYIVNGLFWIIVFSIVAIIYQFLIQTQINNNDTYQSLVSGVISGIVTALIIFIIQILWRKNLLIWIENLLYQDVKIEGEWNGFIVPFIGLDELDKIQKDLAWRRFKRMRKENSINNKKKKTSKKQTEQTTSATIYDEKTGKEETVEAQVIVNNNDNSQEGPRIEKTTVVTLSASPILIRADLTRSGHQIKGKILEIGGASDIHTYDINGTFKNLILTANYESTSENHIDRGALSLMLIKNGEVLEGFFSSYSDTEHRMSPMKYYLSKRNVVSKSE